MIITHISVMKFTNVSRRGNAIPAELSFVHGTSASSKRKADEVTSTTDINTTAAKR